MDKNQIILIGPSGVGKTTIGKLLSNKLKINYFDIDEILHKNIVKKINYNEEEFKNKKEREFEIFEEILNQENNYIISTGEGFIINQDVSILKNIINKIKNIENIILLLPFENNIKSKKMLMKRFDIPKISTDMSLKYDKDVLLFKNIAKKIIYTQDFNEEKILNEILNII